MKRITGVTFFLLLTSLLITGCGGSTSPKPANTLTVGTVQKEIKKGMTQADVASVLGSPNIVTREQEDIEVWIYDKISSTVDYENSNSYGTLILVGGNSGSGSSTASQKTLTVIIKFEKGKVYEFKYHSSRF